MSNSSTKLSNRRAIGRRYEEIAARHYVEMGFEVLERNWQASHKEIDLIVCDDTSLVFVEVKGGRDGSMGHPAYKVDSRKRERLIVAAQAYLQEHDTKGRDIQFDVLVVIDQDDKRVVERYPNAITDDT